MQVTLGKAIEHLRNDLRSAILEGKDKDIVFSPEQVELDFAFKFEAEAKAKGGFNLLALVDLSGEAGTKRGREHRLKLVLKVTDGNGKALKVRGKVPKGL